MKDPRDWDEQYLLSLPVGEFDWIEAKGRRGLDLSCPGVNEGDVREGLSRAASAFANTGGGILVLGMVNPRTAWEVDDGGIDVAMKKPSTREWLEDVIPNLVDFPLHSFNVYCISGKGDGSQIAEGRGVFLISIDDSEQAPHQASDKKYYARIAGKSRPIPHRVVLDILGRRQHPLIQLHFELKARRYLPVDIFGMKRPITPSSPLETPKKRREVTLGIRARNVGRVYTNYMNCQLDLPIALIETSRMIYSENNTHTIEDVGYLRASQQNTRRDVVKAGGMRGATELGPTWYQPILPGLSYSWHEDLKSDLDPQKVKDLIIRWKVFADNASPQSGEIALRDIPFSESEED